MGEEPGGAVCARLDEFMIRMRNVRKHVLAGDFNAHNAAWSEHDTDAMGTDMPAWTNMKGYSVENDIV